jgi:hypothetical protein
MQRFLLTLRLPIAVELINGVLAQLVGASYGMLVFHLISAVVAFWGGRLIGLQPWGTPLLASAVGPLVIFVGFDLVAGFHNALFADFSGVSVAARGTWAEDIPMLAYFTGLFVTSLVLMPFAALISWVGGLAGKAEVFRRKVGD